MKKNLFAGMMIGLFLLGSYGISMATILNFEDSNYAMNGGNYWDANFQSTYGNLDWSSEFGIYYGPGMNSGYNAGTTSGDYAIFNKFGNDVNISIDAGSINWEGAWFSSTRTTGGSINVYGYRNGVQIENGTITLNWENPTWFTANWQDVDTIFFDGAYGADTKRFILDDFTFTANAPVPEPATMLLFGSGLVGLAGWRKTKKS